MAWHHVSVKGDETNWVQTQRSVFKNWVNKNLSDRNMELNEFETDFADGILLINLFEVVAKKQLVHYNKTPRLPSQMLENVTLALKAMEEDGLNLLSIGMLASFYEAYFQQPVLFTFNRYAHSTEYNASVLSENQRSASYHYYF